MDAMVTLPTAPLTDRQQCLLRLLAGGATSADLALRLGLSRGQTDQAVVALLATLRVRTIDEAAVLWWGSRAGARPDLRLAALALVA
jgi:DNA-binding CsgD family transcriptional regulator